MRHKKIFFTLWYSIVALMPLQVSGPLQALDTDLQDQYYDQAVVVSASIVKKNKRDKKKKKKRKKKLQLALGAGVLIVAV